MIEKVAMNFISEIMAGTTLAISKIINIPNPILVKVASVIDEISRTQDETFMGIVKSSMEDITNQHRFSDEYEYKIFDFVADKAKLLLISVFTALEEVSKEEKEKEQLIFCKKVIEVMKERQKNKSQEFQDLFQIARTTEKFTNLIKELQTQPILN